MQQVTRFLIKHEVFVVAPKHKRYIMLRKGIGIFYSEKNGGLVLKTETHWTKISGFWINTDRGCYWLRFRRFP